MLRRILLIFGWAIPFAVLMNIGAGLYFDLTYQASGNSGDNILLTLISRVSGSIDDLALSPLCFFGATMLKQRDTS